jgi:signal transduction histidine kinase
VFTVTDHTVARWRQLRSLAFLVLLTVAMTQDEPRPGATGRGLAILVGLVVAAIAWAAMTFRVGGPRVQPYTIGLCTATGLALCVAAPTGFTPCYLIASTTIAAVTLPVLTAAVFTGVSAAALAVTLLLTGGPPSSVVIWVGVLLLVLLLGIVRRQRESEAEQHRLLATEQAKAATLAERSRVAREIHDVLAHSLSALSVQLETAAALLEKDRAADAAVVVDRAGRLARDGLTETRRAVSALRGDPLPLPELVTELVAGYRTDLDVAASVSLDGQTRAVSPETGLALFRAAQEALTNVRKHAPGSAVRVHLEYRADEVRLTVANSGAAGPPASGLSSGYGLTGLRERAELAGGTVEAGPSPGGWLVDVRMPA